MTRPLLTLLAISLTTAGAFSSFAEESRRTDGKVVVQVGDTGDYQFEVKIDPARKSVSVFSLGKKKDLPNEMSLSLFSDETTGETVNLKAVHLAPGGAPQNGASARTRPPVYQGELDLSSGSYVGMEIQLPLPGNKSWKRIHQPSAFSIDRN